MAFHVRPANNLSSDTNRGFSPAIWGDFNMLDAIGLGNAVCIQDDFHEGFGDIGSVNTLTDSTTGTAGDTLDDTTSSVKDDLASLAAKVNLLLANTGARYKLFRSVGGTAVVGTSDTGGVITLGSDGDNEGASIQTMAKPFKIIRGGGKLWFECRVKSSTITDTKHGFFIGLIDVATLSATVPIAANGTLADENFVGFHRLEGDGDNLDFVYKADGVTQVTVKADTATLVADTWIKVGFKFDPQTNLITHYVNGVPSATTYTLASGAGTDFPNDVQVGLVFAVLNATGSTPGTSSLDWWRCAQML